jgi:hypothetical protein
MDVSTSSCKGADQKDRTCKISSDINGIGKIEAENNSLVFISSSSASASGKLLVQIIARENTAENTS